MIQINHHTFLAEEELIFSTSRSGGPGGQHVNKTSTKVTLKFSVTQSPSLTLEQKALILSRLAGRLNRDGVLQIVAQEHRSQWANRLSAVEKLVDVLRGALKTSKPRRKTRIPGASRLQRLETKRHRGSIKKNRGKVNPE